MNAIGLYTFPNWEDKVFENPNIEIDITHKAHADLLNKTVDLKIDIDNDYGFMLQNIPVESFDFDFNNQDHVHVLNNRVLNHIQTFKRNDL